MSVDKYLVRKKYGENSYGHTTHSSVNSILSLYSKESDKEKIEIFELDVSKLTKLELSIDLKPMP